MGRGRLGVFVQVRLASVRLPGKACLTVGDRSVIEHVMAALGRVEAEVHALLSDAEGARRLGGCALGCGFETFAGSEQDVLLRFCDAIRHYEVSHLVRATGDNPLVSPRLVRLTLEEYHRSGADLCHTMGNPLGTGVEVIRGSALLRAGEQARAAEEREHISTYLYRHPELFRIHEPQAPPECLFRNALVSVDTTEDYERVRRIFADLYAGEPIETEAVVLWLQRHPEMVRLHEISY